MSFETRFFGILILLLAFVSAGCTPPSDPLLDMMDSELKKTKVDDLSRTMDFIAAEIRFSQKEFNEKISTGLNRWASTSERSKEMEKTWIEDEFSKPSFEANQNLAMLKRNAEMSFLNTDAYYIQQSTWMLQVANRVTESNQLNPFEFYRLSADNFKPDEDSENKLADVVAKLHPDLSSEETETLTDSLAVFDWVVRNIQLLPDPNYTEQEADDLRLFENEDGPAASGIPGLGYTRYPWQSLLYGQADYVERAKLVMLGLRQLNIDSVMLATKSDEASQPWVIGVCDWGRLLSV